MGENGGLPDDGSESHGEEVEAFSDSEEQIESSSSSQSSSTSPPSSAVKQEEEEEEELKSTVSDMEMMKERFAKLLLGEDMSGCGNGVSTALAISNAIANLSASVFGQLWRLEPLPSEKKCMWRREMDWLLCVSDHIVELIPSWQTFPDGTKLEVMTCRPRSDLYINLPALRKLDNILLEILDDFRDTEFWYVDQGLLAPENFDGSASFGRPIQHQHDKWWLPVPRLPPGCGLRDKTMMQLQHKRECASQILKAALAINSNALAEMDVPDSYLESLPKNGRASLGDAIHRYITSDRFSPDHLLDCLDLSSEHQALEIANSVEASVYLWRRRRPSSTNAATATPHGRSSWGMVKEFVVSDLDKRELLADRAESILLCLKQRFPALTQTSLDISKIQSNKDVGKSILESYSRVLESLAFNMVARIDDLLYVDDLSKNSDKFTPISTVGIISHKRASLPSTSAAFASPKLSPAQFISPARGERTPFISRKPFNRGFGVKKVLSDYLGVEMKGRTGSNNNHVVQVSAPVLIMNQDASSVSSTRELEAQRFAS